jgi:hypothetical protein
VPDRCHLLRRRRSADQAQFTKINAEFFSEIGSPGGAADFGAYDGDHPLVAALPPKE